MVGTHGPFLPELRLRCRPHPMRRPRARNWAASSRNRPTTPKRWTKLPTGTGAGPATAGRRSPLPRPKPTRDLLYGAQWRLSASRSMMRPWQPGMQSTSMPAHAPAISIRRSGRQSLCRAALPTLRSTPPSPLPLRTYWDICSQKAGTPSRNAPRRLLSPASLVAFSIRATFRLVWRLATRSVRLSLRVRRRTARIHLGMAGSPPGRTFGREPIQSHPCGAFGCLGYSRRPINSGHPLHQRQDRLRWPPTWPS